MELYERKSCYRWVEKVHAEEEKKRTEILSKPYLAVELKQYRRELEGRREKLYDAVDSERARPRKTRSHNEVDNLSNCA